MTSADVRTDEASGSRRVQLDVTGMSCGACSRRVESKLNKIDGVRASVDFATKVATVDARHDVSVADLCDVVEQAGYRATERAGDAPPPPSAQNRPSAMTRAIRWASLGHLGGAAS